jgi:hypothetical protein
MINVKVFITRDLGKMVEDIDRRKRIALNKKVQESLEYVKNKIASYAPMESGDLKNTILSLPTTSIKTRGLSIMYGSGSIEMSILLGRRKDKKIRWVNDGTGLFGPRRRWIYPTKKSVMAFKVDGKWVVVKRTKGQKGQKFIQRGIRASKLIISSKILSALKS